MKGSANLNLMIKSARRAAKSLLRDFGEVENLQVSMKGAGDFVSKADLAAEEIIKEDLLDGRPTYGWLAEESEEITGSDPTRRWLVDPLDGTTNFLHGLPHWAISIALEHKGEVVTGVILDPIKDEIFFAEKGQGAWLNETRLRVSARARLMESIFATGLPRRVRQNSHSKGLEEVRNLLPVCAGIRRWGSAALDLAYVAAGRYEGYWDRELNAWDLAAGLIILRESGGLAESINPGKNILYDGEVIAANALVFEKFQKLIRK